MLFSRYYDKDSPEIEVSVKYKIFEWQIISGPAPILTDIELQSFAAQLHAKKIGRINGGRVGIAIILNLLDSPKNFHLIQVIATQCIKIDNHEIDFLSSEDKDTIHKFEYFGLYL